MVEAYNRADFFDAKIVWLGSFSDHFFLKMMDQKMTRAKKVAKTKIHFFHARRPPKGIFEIYS